MTETSPEGMPQHFAPRWGGDTREPVPSVGDEREILTGMLDYQRATFALKCSGLSPEQLSRKSIEPSGLSLHGLLRHLAGVERWWFRQRFAGEQVPMLFYSDEDPDQDFESLDGDPAEVFALWQAECELSREIVAKAPSLEVTGTLVNGEPIMLRRILANHIAEYARHNGHADLLRERIDGATGV